MKIPFLKLNAGIISLVILCLLGLSLPLDGICAEKESEQETSIYEIDLAHSSILFRVRHLVSVVKGSFRKFSGQIHFASDVQDWAAEGTIEAASIDTNNQKRDEHLKSSDFFDVTKFPEVKFTSKRVTKQNVIGSLTLCGVTKEVVLEYVFHGLAKDQNGKKRIGFSATGMISRREFGIFYNKEVAPGVLLLGDEVPFEIEIEAVEKTK